MEVGAPKVTSGDNLVKETTSARENIKPMVPVEGNKKGCCSGRGSDEPLWKDFLVCRFLSAAPHVAKIHVIVNKVWPWGLKS
ncbi:hypothetical protein Bca4012_044162 [Brassica carinata]